MIMKLKRKSRLAVIGAITLTIVLSVGVTVAGAYAMPNPSPTANSSSVETSQMPINSNGARNLFADMQRAGNALRASFQDRFPNSQVTQITDINFSGSWNVIGKNLEVSLLNTSLRIVSYDGDRFSMESNNRYTGFTLHDIFSDEELTIYIWDSITDTNALITLFVPSNLSKYFEQANIFLENGNLEIDETVYELLAENLNINMGNGAMLRTSAQAMPNHTVPTPSTSSPTTPTTNSEISYSTPSYYIVIVIYIPHQG